MFSMEYKSSPNVYFIQVNILASAGTVSAREAPAEAFYSCAVSSRLLAWRDGVLGSLTSAFGLAGTWGTTTVPLDEEVPSYSTAVTLPLGSFMVHDPSDSAHPHILQHRVIQ